ncbi:MAG: TolC family protein [Alphaproteobacteria bacterium]|nr:TolC family protein [Alphaproteobacteria bacterium]
MRHAVPVLVLSIALAGCAFYRPAPLPAAPDTAATMPGPAASLDMAAVAREAVARSPELAALRAKSEVAEAQAAASGLLPEPQLSLSGDHPTVHMPDLTNGYAMGLSEDLQQLLTFPSRLSAARASEAQSKLDLLWNEWQVVERAGTLYAQKLFLDEKAARLRRTASLMLRQADHSQAALAAGNTTLDLAGADLSTALDLSGQADSAARDALAADAGLRMLLVLKPDAPLQLAPLGDPEPYTREQVSEALATVDKKRPDLLALQAGYHAQEENVRTAILQQFPAITLGFNRASDTTGVQTNGLALTVNLPIFGGVQNTIRLQRATRTQLKAEYQTRLNQTESDAWRLYAEMSLLRDQVTLLEAKLPEFERMGEVGQRAYIAGDLPAATYVILETSLSARLSELYDLKSQLWSDTLALHSILAMPLIAPAEVPPK